MARTAKVIALPNTCGIEKWVERVNAAWREQLPAIFETGNLLEAAKNELKYGEWEAIFREGKLPFAKATARKLIAISNNDNLRDGSHVNHLPVHWGTLYQLALLTYEQFEDGIKSGAIHPMMQRKEALALRGIELKKKDQDQPTLIKSLSRCLAHVRRTIQDAWRELPDSDRSQLFLELRAELDDLEGKINENHAAC